MLVHSDIGLSPQALVLSPESTIEIASAIVAQADPYHQTLAAARAAVDIIERSVKQATLTLPAREQDWLNKISRALDDMPDKEESLISEMADTYAHRFSLSSYGF